MKVYLAGYETAANSYKVKLDKTANLFLTYFYDTNTERALPNLKPKGHKGLITVDSGAHSFFEIAGVSCTASTATKKPKKAPDPHKYLDEYLRWAKEYYKLFDYFCELDLQQLLGQEVVDEWRAKAVSMGIAKKMIVVHHRENTWEEFEKILETPSGYIGIEGLRPNTEMLPYNTFLKAAYAKQVKVHGFAFTKPDILRQCPFYSVDSSSWTSGPRFGSMHYWDGDAMRTITPKEKNFFKYNVPVDLFNTFTDKDASRRKCEYSAKSYIRMQNDMTRLWESRGIKWKD